MREQNRQGRIAQELVGDASEERFPNTAMAETADYEKVCTVLAGEFRQACVKGGSENAQVNLRAVHPMCLQIGRDIVGSEIWGAWSLQANEFDDLSLFKEWHRRGNCVRGGNGIVPADHDFPKCPRWLYR